MRRRALNRLIEFSALGYAIPGAVIAVGIGGYVADFLPLHPDLVALIAERVHDPPGDEHRRCHRVADHQPGERHQGPDPRHHRVVDQGGGDEALAAVHHPVTHRGQPTGRRVEAGRGELADHPPDRLVVVRHPAARFADPGSSSACHRPDKPPAHPIKASLVRAGREAVRPRRQARA